jgi:NADPH:quinone reductase
MQYVLDHPTPEPTERDVLIQNASCGINYVDTYFRSGFYESPKPEVLGREGSGVVVAPGPSTGQAHDLKVGDRLVWLETGSYAQYTSVAVEKGIKVPEAIPLEDAAGCFLSGLTALALVDEAYKVAAGDWVLLHAGAPTVGILMIQILEGLGAKVIATAGGAEKCQVARSLGADHVIDYRIEADGKWAEVVKTITGGRGVEVVYDSVGKDTWEGSLEAVRRKGMIVWLGNASGPVPLLALQ